MPPPPTRRAPPLPPSVAAPSFSTLQQPSAPARQVETPPVEPYPNPQDPPGFLGFEVLRAYADQHSNSKLIGALRGQIAQPQYRFGSGHGTFRGPYYGIDQASPRLTLPHFRNLLKELNLNLPEGEVDAVFLVIAGSLDGTVGLAELLREIRAEPCDRAARWGRKHTGQIWAEGRRTEPNVRVVPTARSAYSDGGWRKAPVRQAENVPPPRPQPPPVHGEGLPYRVAGSDPTPFNSGANVLRTNIVFGPSEETGTWHRKPPPPPPKVSRGKATHSGRGPQLHSTSDNDPDRWRRDSIGARRPPPVLPVNARVLPPDPTGFTRAESLFIGGEPEPLPPPPPPPMQPTVLAPSPWVSGYNRGERRDHLQLRKEAWANEGASPKKKPVAPSEYYVAPSRESGWVSNECTLCAKEGLEGRPGQCAFCRLHG